MPRVAIERLRKVAVITSAGFSVVLIEASWPSSPPIDGVRPALIASTAQVNAPVITGGGGAGITPPLINSTSSVGAPAVTGAASPDLAPSPIASAAAVGAPVVTRATPPPAVFANGAWNDTATWSDTDIWKDAA